MPLPHRTNTGPQIRQTATRVSDGIRFRSLADGITVVGVREGRQQAHGGGDVPGPDILGPMGKKEKTPDAGLAQVTSGLDIANK